MDRVEFGVTLPSVKGIAEFVRSAEALDYDYVGCAEHMMFHGPVGNSLIGLSVAAGVTTKIKLMSSVVLLPLYNPDGVGKTDVGARCRFLWPLPHGDRHRRRISEGVRGMRRSREGARLARE